MKCLVLFGNDIWESVRTAMSKLKEYRFLSDEELFRELQSDQRESLTVLFDRYHRKFFLIALKYLKDEEMAKDAVQSVFIKLWESRHRIRIETSLSNYLFTMLKYRVLNDIRSKKSAIARNYVIFQQSERLEDDCGKRLEDRELVLDLHHAIGSLPEQKRRVCQYKLRGDMSNEEIAEEMDLTVATVKSHYSEAVKKLKLFLAKWFES